MFNTKHTSLSNQLCKRFLTFEIEQAEPKKTNLTKFPTMFTNFSFILIQILLSICVSLLGENNSSCRVYLKRNFSNIFIAVVLFCARWA